jgi:putative hemolysin
MDVSSDVKNPSQPIDFTYASSNHSRTRQTIVRTIENLSGQRRLRDIYHNYVASEKKQDFFDTAIDKLNLHVNYDPEKLSAIPKDRPVLFIANHPYGVADGIILTWLARQARPDVRVMANDVLCQAPEALSNLLPVSFDGTREALQTNIKTRKTAIKNLQDNKAIGIFPSGGVAAVDKPWARYAVDPQWHVFLAKMVQSCNVTVVPFYFHGQNSRLFQLSSHLSYTLRLALYFHETHRLMNNHIRVEIGDPIEPENLAQYKDRDELVRFLRKQTYGLALKNAAQNSHKKPLWQREYQFPSYLKF